MAASINSSPPPPEQDLLGQTVLLIGGSSGIGLEAARLARAQGADIILTARNPDRLYRAGLELGASIAAFDATDFGRLGRFFDALPAPIDHLLITGPGPYRPRLAEFDLDAARRDIDAHLLLPLQARHERREQGPPGRHPALPGGCLPPSRRNGRRVHCGAHSRAFGRDQGPRARGRARPGQPDRGRLRRDAAWRHAACRSCRWPGQHRRLGRPPHDQHRRHRRDLRHRQRPAGSTKMNARYPRTRSGL